MRLFKSDVLQIEEDRIKFLKRYYKKVFKFFKENYETFKEDSTFWWAYEVSVKESILTSYYVYLQALRFLLFLYRSLHEKDFPYFYDTNAIKILAKFASAIIIPETNKPFIFVPFRKFIAGFVFGFKYKNDPERLLTKHMFDIEARKQWKSSFWALIALAVSVGYNKNHFAEIYFIGPQGFASRIPFNMAHNYILKSTSLRTNFSKYNSQRILSKNQGQIRHLPFTKESLEGKNPSLVVLTEYHMHRSDELQESAQTAFNMSRKNQMIVYDTTKGESIDSVCYEREKQYKQYLLEQIINPTITSDNADVFLFCAELDYEDYEDWKNPKLWIKANPNLGVSISIEQLKSELAKIKDRQSENEFKIKRLGMWVSLAAAHFSLPELLRSQAECDAIVQKYIKDKNLLSSCFCVLGVDLSLVSDTTCLLLCFEIPTEDKDNILYFKAHSFVPSLTIEKRIASERLKFVDFNNQGFLSFTKGEIVDFEEVAAYAKDLKTNYRVSCVAYDAWQFATLKQIFLKWNIFSETDLFNIKQGVYLTPAFKEFERKLRLGKVHFDNNKLLISQILSTSVRSYTRAGTGDLYSITKINRYHRIDSFMAALNAISFLIDTKQDLRSINSEGIILDLKKLN